MGNVLQHLLRTTKDARTQADETHTHTHAHTRITPEQMVILEQTVFNYICSAKGKTQTRAQNHMQTHKYAHVPVYTHTHTHMHTHAHTHCWGFSPLCFLLNIHMHNKHEIIYTRAQRQ